VKGITFLDGLLRWKQSRVYVPIGKLCTIKGYAKSAWCAHGNTSWWKNNKGVIGEDFLLAQNEGRCRALCSNMCKVPKYQICHNPNLGLTTKARAYKGVGQEWAHESHFMLPGMQESVREWTPTLPSGSPNGLLNLQRAIVGVKIHWIDKKINIIGKILELKFLKWVCMTHLGF
jgi:hypothetical protein